jgi:hypothetical protein
MRESPLAIEDWQSLLEDPEGRAALLFPIVTFGSEEGWRLLAQMTILELPRFGGRCWACG